LADRYGSPKCCAYTMKKMHKMEWSAELQAEIFTILLLLSVGLEGMPEYMVLKKAIMTGLLKIFSDLWLVMSDDKRKCQWCKLTWPVVVAVLQDPLVNTDCEDTVAC
jgi:hypothetical protein